MKKPLLVLSVIGGLAMVLLGPGAFVKAAGNDPSHDPKIMERFERQQQRIDNGLKKGVLTKDEAAQVQGNLDRIKAEEAKLKADGKLTLEAKKSLNHKLDLNSKMIDAEKKNPIVQIPSNPASPGLQTPSTTPSATPLPTPTPSTPSTTPSATPLPIPTPSTSGGGEMKRGGQEREQDGKRDMGRRHMSKEEHERMKAERKAEREQRKAERKARHHERDKDDHDDDDKDNDKDDEKGRDRDDHDKGKKKGKHGRERD